jgi:hypothetical protein
MVNFTKSVKALGQVVGLLIGNNFSRPIEQEMIKHPYFVYSF